MRLICGSSRWRNGQDIDPKSDSKLLAVIDRSWTQRPGAMEAFDLGRRGRHDCYVPRRENEEARSL
eukprot:7611269-Pyramimonas_sp.AAC.2